jgi:hypothetical protein
VHLSASDEEQAGSSASSSGGQGGVKGEDGDDDAGDDDDDDDREQDAEDRGSQQAPVVSSVGFITDDPVPFAAFMNHMGDESSEWSLLGRGVGGDGAGGYAPMGIGRPAFG